MSAPRNPRHLILIVMFAIVAVGAVLLFTLHGDTPPQEIWTVDQCSRWANAAVFEDNHDIPGALSFEEADEVFRQHGCEQYW